ncbi:MAG: nickel insertion protein, partial [Lachnospirales bacterium]
MEKKILYFDVLSGISGDMTIGALIDLKEGIDLDFLTKELKKLKLTGYKLSA